MLGPFGPEASSDLLGRIDSLILSRAIEEENSTRPVFFGPRICKEPFLDCFLLSWVTPKYNGSAKPEDYPIDYLRASPTGTRRAKKGLQRRNSRFSCRASILV